MKDRLLVDVIASWMVQGGRPHEDMQDSPVTAQNGADAYHQKLFLWQLNRDEWRRITDHMHHKFKAEDTVLFYLELGLSND